MNTNRRNIFDLVPSRQRQRSMAYSTGLTLDYSELDERDDWLDQMDESERENYEHNVRKDVIKAIDKFLEQKNIEEAMNQFSNNLRMEKLDGCNAQMRSQIFVAQMLYKFSQISDKLIDSYIWECKRDMKIPKNPSMLREMMSNILDINENKLIKLFVDHLDEQ